MRQIYTYVDVKSLINEPFYDIIAASPTITVSRGMRDGLNDLGSLGLKHKAVDFQDVFQLISEHWLDEYDSMNKAALTEEFFRKKISSTSSDLDVKWLRNCRKNKFFLLSAVGLLAEAGITYNDLIVTSKETQLMKDLYRYILDNDNSIQTLFSSIESLYDVNRCHNFMIKLFGKSDFNNIILHSFYYITPLQERIISAFENCGYNLIFLIPFDEKYCSLYTIWEETYSVERGYPQKSDWIKASGHLSNPLGDAYTYSSITNKHCSIHEQKSVMTFIEDVRRTRAEGYEMYSTDHASANELLHNYFPQEFERRNLLSYPVGQFIFNIHSAWDNDYESVVLDESVFKEICATGWLSYGSDSSLDYFDDLCSVFPFFQDCFTLSQWEKRLDYFIEVRAKAIKPFTELIEKDGRIPYLSNPLSNFSIFALSDYSFNSVCSIMKQLFRLLHSLFDEHTELTISQHFSKINEFIHDNCPVIKRDGPELLVLKNILNRISFNHNSRKYSPQDICSSIIFFLSQGFDTFGDDGSKKNGMVNPFYQLDSASLKSQKIHILMADAKRLPGKEREYVWPLNRDYIESLYNSISGQKQYLISSLMHIMGAFPLVNRYMMFSALNNENVIVSWISRIEEKNLQPSPFIRLLSDMSNTPILDVSPEILSFNFILDVIPASDQIVSKEVTANPDLIKEARIDYALCPLKYIYGYVLSKHPFFKNRFTMNMALGGLISALRGLDLGVSYNSIIENIYMLFPFIRDSEKRQTIDYTYSGDSSYYEFKDFEYSESRFLIEYPTKEYRDTALLHYGFLLSPNGRVGFDIYNIPDVEKICMYCQYSDDCRKALHQDDALPGVFEDD